MESVKLYHYIILQVQAEFELQNSRRFVEFSSKNQSKSFNKDYMYKFQVEPKKVLGSLYLPAIGTILQGMDTILIVNLSYQEVVTTLLLLLLVEFYCFRKEKNQKWD